MKEKVQNFCLPKFEGSPTRIIKTIIQIKVEEITHKPPSSIEKGTLLQITNIGRIFLK
jgi:hypothetical protein